MRQKLTSVVLLTAICLSICGALSACTVRVQNPYDNIYIPNPYVRLTALEEPETMGWNTVEITMAKNEGEGAQLCVRSDTEAYTNMVISVSDLKSDNGDILSADSFQLYREEFINRNCKTGEYYGDKRDGSAQILVPLTQYPEFNTFTTTPGRNLIYYIKAVTSTETAAGTYTGKVSLTHSAGSFEVPIKVTVLDFALQTRPLLRSDLLYWSFADRYYGYDTSTAEGKAASRARFDEALEICRSNKLNVSNAYDVPNAFAFKDPADYITALKAFLEKNPTVTTINAPIAYSDWENRIINTERTMPYLNALEEAGLLSMAIMYSVDEPHNDQDYLCLNNLGKWVKENCPNLKNYVPIIPSALDMNKVDEDAIGIWCYGYGACTVDMLKKGQTGERELWGYAFDKSPYNSISQVRMMGLECKKFNLGGIEDWCLDSYTYGYEDGLWQLNKDSAYLFAYTFPAEEGDDIVGREMLLPTFIVEEFRDACEDYEYYTRLEQMVQEKIDELSLPLDKYEAMESYYDGLFLDVHRLPDNEEYGFYMARQRVIDELQNGIPYILTTSVDNKMWETDNRYITIYTDAGNDVVFNGEKLETTTEGKYSVAKLYKTIGSESKTYEIECGGKTTKQHLLSKDFDKKPVINLESAELYDALKEANPNTSFEIYKENGKYTMKVTFDSSTKRGFIIPAECLATPVGNYYTVRCNAWSDSDDNTFVPVFQLLSATSNISSDHETKYSPTTDRHVPFTGSFEPAQAKEVGAKLKSFRIRLDKSTTEPVTLYFSDIFFIDESNNFKWEIVE